MHLCVHQSEALLSQTIAWVFTAEQDFRMLCCLDCGGSAMNFDLPVPVNGLAEVGAFTKMVTVRPRGSWYARSTGCTLQSGKRDRPAARANAVPVVERVEPREGVAGVPGVSYDSDDPVQTLSSARLHTAISFAQACPSPSTWRGCSTRQTSYALLSITVPTSSGSGVPANRGIASREMNDVSPLTLRL
jgi:hypothetical protein